MLHLPADETCKVCRVSKIRRRRMIRKESGSESVNSVSFNHSVSVDLLDPTLIGIDGNRYLFTHLDEHTGWTTVIGVKRKVPAEVKNALEEAQRGKGWPKFLKCDSGNEFAAEFDECLRKNLVEKLEGVAHRPNTHARHERMHADLNAGVRALLVQAGLPTEWYPYAIKYWVLARNLAWPMKDGKTPFEKRYGIKWTKSIPVFGTGAIVYREEKESKFEPNGRLGAVLGFTVPRAHDHRQLMNLIIGFPDDLRPVAVRKVLEFKLMDNTYPFRKLKLRGELEQDALEFDEKKDREKPGEGNGQSPEGTSESRSELSGQLNKQGLKFCSKCKKPIFRHKEATCARCVAGPGSGETHRRDSTCFKQACQCPRLMSTGELVPKLNTEVAEPIRRAETNGANMKTALPMSRLQHAMNMSKTSGLLEALNSNNATLHSTSQLQTTVLDPLYFVNVAEILPMKSAMETSEGQDAFKQELLSLIAVGALQFKSATEHRMAKLTKNARFVRLKPIMGVKNSEMPKQFQKHKCRIVAQGCIVKNGDGSIADPDIFPFDKPPGLISMRCAMSTALLEYGADAEAAFFDIDCAYLHAPLGGDPTFGTLEALLPYLKESLPSKEVKRLMQMERPVVRLGLALYGLTRSGSDFASHAREVLLGKRWKESESDMNVYYRRDQEDRKCTLILYVDDGAIFGHKECVVQAVKELRECFRISKPVEYVTKKTKHEPVRYLGISVYTANNHWCLDSSDYATHIARQAPSGRRRTTPLSDKTIISEHPNSCPHAARKTLGQLLWLSRTTRPDISHAVALIARCVDRWDPQAERGLEDILRYLANHTGVILKYEVPLKKTRNVSVSCYTDADHDANRSTSGHILFLKGENAQHLISWGSRRQRRVATSTAESELIALHSAIQGCVFPVGIYLEETQKQWPCITVYCDNQTAIKVAIRGFSDAMVHASKTQRICVKWLAELVKDVLIDIQHVPTRANLADMMTKPIATDVFRGHARGIGLSYPGFFHSAVETPDASNLK